MPGVASILLLVAHEALETERDIQGAVEEEEVGGVVAKEAVEVVGMKPGEELLDRRVVELALSGFVESSVRRLRVRSKLRAGALHLRPPHFLPPTTVRSAASP